MASVFSRLRRRLDAAPLWIIAAINAGVLGAWLLDFRIPDPIPYADKIFLGLVFGGTAVYLWNRFFGPPGALSAAARRKIAEIELLFDEAKRAAVSMPGAAAEVERLHSFLEKVKAIEQRLEQTEIVLLTPQYDARNAADEVARLTREADSATGPAKESLAGALEEARKHAANIAHIQTTRDELSAAFERIYQLVKRIHSQILSVGLQQGSTADVSTSVDELARTLEAYEREQEALLKAQAIADEEIADAVRKGVPKTDAH